VRCKGCGEKREPVAGPQHATGFRAWYVGGSVYCGGPDEWRALPDEGVLGVRVCFSDGTARVCSGNDWYGLLSTSDGFWTVIHNNDSLAENEKRYPSAIWKRGLGTSDAEMQSVNAAMSEG
jgi:hypothetical protein